MNGKEKILSKYKEMRVQDKTTIINLEAIENLPEEFEPIEVEVYFDPNDLDKSFVNMGSKSKPSWYPRTELSNEIAAKRGIEGYGEKIIETVRTEVDINPLLMLPIESPPTIRLMEVGVRVSKRGKVLSEDGTYWPSSLYTKEENFWDDALKAWLQEEEDSENYKKKKWTKTFNGKTYDYYAKYDTVIRRRKSLLDFKNHALAKADTKSWVKVIRYLAGISNGFATEDLKSGKFTFCKIVKSKTVIKLETAARIDAIRNGRSGDIEAIGGNVYNDFQIEAPQPHKIGPEVFGVDSFSTIEESEPEPESFGAAPPPTELSFADKSETEKREFLKKILESYLAGPNLEVLEKIQHAVPVIESTIKDYLKSDINGIISIVKTIEEKPGIIKIDHDIFYGAK
jgi:hypothetical protein